jgi:RecB family exonuclease
MSLEVAWVPYGRAAAQALHARIAGAKADDPLRPVTVVVPTNTVGVSVRRLLASGDLGQVTSRGAGLAGVGFLTIYRLAELLGASRLAAQGRRPVSMPVLSAVVRRVLRQQPGLLGPVADHPATEAALVRAHRELSEVTPDALDALAAASPRAADVVRLHRAVRAILADRWYAEADLMAAATEAADAVSPVLADVGHIVVHLPQRLGPGPCALLARLAGRAPVTVLAGCTGDADADAEVAGLLRDLGALLPAPDVAEPTATEVVSVSDAEEEARHAVRRVLVAARAGVPLERIGICYPSADPYACLVHEQLAAAGVPSHGLSVRPLSDRLLGRWLLDLLEMPTGGHRRQDVLHLLATAPVSDRHGQRVPVGRWERVSRAAGIVRGRRDWDGRLAAHAARLRLQAAAAEGDPEAPGWLAGRLRGEAGDAESLRGFALGVFAALDRLARADSWAGLVTGVQDLVRRYLGAADRRTLWPGIERAAADRVDAALERIAVLDTVDGDPDPGALARILELELDADLGRSGRFGEGVLVGPLASVVGVDLELVVCLGLAEGVLPARVNEDSLLPDDERRVAGGQLQLRAEAVHTQHRQLLAAIASGRQCVLSFPRGDLRRSTERAPSRWLLDTVEALGEPGQRALPRERRADGTQPWYRHHASFAASVLRDAQPATRQDWALRALAEHHRNGGELGSHPLLRADRVLARGAEMVAARRSSAFTRFDGDLRACRRLLPDPTDPTHVTSATRLQLWAQCPHAYLVHHVLGIGEVANPEELLEISPLHRGSLVHEALEAWLRDRITAGDVPEPHQPWSAEARAALRSCVEARCATYAEQGLTGYALLWSRDRQRILADAERLMDEDDRRRSQFAARPVAAELAFGIGGAPPLEVALPDGRSIRIRGLIDRLETAASDRIVVTDYKLGSTRGYQELKSGDDPVARGAKLQLGVYALAARAHLGQPDAPVTAQYWFTSAKGDFEQIGDEFTAAADQRFRGVLQAIVDGIGAGLFPAHPEVPTGTPFVSCACCDPDGLGTGERRRAWERKRLDPALRAYTELAEPEVLEQLRVPT